MKAQRSTNVQPHQRQYQSDQLLFDPSVANKWLQGEYGSGTRGLQRGASGEIYVAVEPASPLPRNWSREELVSSSQFSPGLLDLHSCDTELLPESGGHGFYDGSYAPGYNKGSINDLGPSFNLNKQMAKPDALPEHGYLKSFPVDKEKLASVAKIKVVVRKRPLNKKEIAKKEEDIISIEGASNCLTVHETKLKVYRETVEPVVPAIFQRTKATCFAYVQTGIGKTFTMKPLPLKASQDILRLMNQAYRNQGFQLFVSFFEIYGGKLFDLLNDRKKLLMREDGKQKVCIVGLQEYRVNDVEMIRELFEKGNATRSTGTTGANEESSRSHAILQLAIKRLVDGNESKPPRPIGKLSFIDLAGSERGADTTDNDKQTRIEGAEINKSLLALKECIRALDNDETHIPFRGSKLTEMLSDSFIGDSRTVMISCIYPSSGSCEHALNTLRYADSYSAKSVVLGVELLRELVPIIHSFPIQPSTDFKQSSPLTSTLAAATLFLHYSLPPSDLRRQCRLRQPDHHPTSGFASLPYCSSDGDNEGNNKDIVSKVANTSIIVKQREVAGEAVTAPKKLLFSTGKAVPFLYLWSNRGFNRCQRC
ncbi:hypothetical protein LUZ61_005489 [Rhynchospora tenuis]|uniref:Kinesin-like protein n=1 Tax=Rhynchospora tenuis TaxID=198213 RepID=A0AAD6EUR2_9POAL|nr:hypothetical protein LUZ61_005489 [Rhynchospora tenuis]